MGALRFHPGKRKLGSCGGWTDEFEAGKENEALAQLAGRLAAGAYETSFAAQAWGDIGYNGRFDYQRAGGTFHPELRDMTNRGVGVYFAGAGWSQSDMDVANAFILKHVSTRSELIPGDMAQWNAGRAWALKACAPH